MNLERQRVVLRALNEDRLFVGRDGVTIFGTHHRAIGYRCLQGFWSINVSVRGEGCRAFSTRAANVIWLRAHGLIPDGFVVTHKDGDMMNHRLDNLELVTKSEVSRRVREHKND